MDQPGHLKEEVYLSIKVIADPQSCCSFCHNPFSDGKDKITERALIKSNDTHIPISTALHTFTPLLAPAPPSNNGLFQQYMKIYLENPNQNQASPPTPI